MKIEPKAASRKMLVINGHPDPRPERFCAAICAAYSHGARSNGWQTQQVNIGELGYSLFDAAAEQFACSEDVERGLRLVRDTDRLMIAFPLWLDHAPPALEMFLREATRRSMVETPDLRRPAAKCGRMFVTMQMPAFIYRPRQLAKDRRSTCGMALPLPLEKRGAPTFIGSLDSLSAEQRASWLEKIRAFGEHDC